MFEELNKLTDEVKLLTQSFDYPGCKIRLAKKIIPLLPYRKLYVEPFAGTGVILFSRYPSEIDIFNDKDVGIIQFYKIVKNNYVDLINRLELTLHSREEFVYCRDTWMSISDPVESSARWYQSIMHSYGGIGRKWGRGLTEILGMLSIHKRFPRLDKIHERLKDIEIENRDWYDCLLKYDSVDTVFYIDPPYPEFGNVYDNNLTSDDHERLLETIMNLKGFVAISGYPNTLYEDATWDNDFEWNHSKMFTDKGNSIDNIERLWIKE